MQNKTINIGVVTKVARALKELNNEMVYVGGAVISLYTDDPAADEVRPTKDIDMTVHLVNYASWVTMQERLAQLGFSPDMGDTVICRYKYEDVQIDIMPSTDIGIGPPNPWYERGIKQKISLELDHHLNVQLLPPAYFIATKFKAFHDRGGDYRISHDFEDIIYLIDNRTTIDKEILESDDEVKNFIQSEFGKIWNSPYRDEFISVQLSPVIADD